MKSVLFALLFAAAAVSNNCLRTVDSKEAEAAVNLKVENVPTAGLTQAPTKRRRSNRKRPTNVPTVRPTTTVRPTWPKNWKKSYQDPPENTPPASDPKKKGLLSDKSLGLSPSTAPTKRLVSKPTEGGATDNPSVTAPPVLIGGGHIFKLPPSVIEMFYRGTPKPKPN